MLPCCGETPAPSSEERFGGLIRDVQSFGNFGHRQFVEMTQGQGGPLPLGQGGQHRNDLIGQSGVGTRLVAVRCSVECHQPFESLATALVGPPLIDHTIAGGDKQPGPIDLMTSTGGEHPGCGHKRLRRCVVSRCGVTGSGQAEAVHRVELVVEQLSQLPTTSPSAKLGRYVDVACTLHASTTLTAPDICRVRDIFP